MAIHFENDVGKLYHHITFDFGQGNQIVQIHQILLFSQTKIAQVFVVASQHLQNFEQ
jgi:hypothetical protein